MKASGEVKRKRVQIRSEIAKSGVWSAFRSGDSHILKKVKPSLFLQTRPYLRLSTIPLWGVIQDSREEGKRRQPKFLTEFFMPTSIFIVGGFILWIACKSQPLSLGDRTPLSEVEQKIRIVRNLKTRNLHLPFLFLFFQELFS